MKTHHSVIAILIGICCCGCIMLPVPHYRMHAYGVTGRILSESGNPVECAVIDGKYHSDQNGSYRVRPIYGLHAVYMIGPICMSLLPAWDATGPARMIRISAPGFENGNFFVGREDAKDSVPVMARVDGSYLHADDIHLIPVLKTQDSGLRTQD